MTYEEIKNNEEINLLIEKGNEVLGELGYTEHSKKTRCEGGADSGKNFKRAWI